MSSSNIYSSQKNLPYVYVCFNFDTNELYIGSRYSSKLKYPSHIDFPKYKTSSSTIKNNFDNFKWLIVAEFFTPNDAYNYEQQLIHEWWEYPNLLNKHHYYNKHQFRCLTHKGHPHTKESINKIKQKRAQQTNVSTKEANLAIKGKPKSEEHKQKIRNSQKGIKCDNRKWTEERKLKFKLKTTGIKRPQYVKCSCTKCHKVIGANVLWRHYESHKN